MRRGDATWSTARVVIVLAFLGALVGSSDAARAQGAPAAAESAKSAESAEADGAPVVGAAAGGLANYDPSSEEWNGLSSLRQVLERRGCRVESATEVDLDRLPVTGSLWLVHPTSRMEGTAVARWVERGGRLLVADDFGTADGLLGPFGLTRVPWVSGMDPGFEGRPEVPRVGPVGRHPLTEGLGSVVANHPSALRGPGTPVFRFRSGGGLVYDMSLGEGRAVFVSDASMLINLMLPIADNERFVGNVVRTLQGPGPCEITLATGAIVLRGDGTGGSGRRGLDASVEAIDALLDGVTTRELRRDAVQFAAVLLMLGTILVLATVFPWRLPEWLRLDHAPRPTASRSDWEAAVHRYRGRFGERDHTWPAAILRGMFEPVFYGGLELRVPERGRGGDAMRRKAAEIWVNRYESGLTDFGRARRSRQVERFLHAIAAVPERERALLADARVDGEALRDMFNTASELLGKMGRGDAFEEQRRRPA